MSIAKVPRDRSGLQMDALKGKEPPARSSKRATSQLTSLLASKALNGSTGSLRSLEQRRSIPIPVKQVESSAQSRNHHEGYSTDSSEDGQPFYEPRSMKQSPAMRVPQLKSRLYDPGSQTSLAASLDEDGSHRFIPPHEMSMPANEPCYMDLSYRPGSLYEGVGRKLRGLDAMRFRQSVMRQTGFLEPSSDS